MAQSHGKDSVFKVDDSGGTLRDITAHLDSVDFPQTVDTAESSTFGDTAKEYFVGLKDATISISGKWDNTTTTGPDAVLGTQPSAGASRTFEYGPEGGTTGKIKYSGECHLTSYQITGSIGDMVTFSAEFQVTGAVTRGTWA